MKNAAICALIALAYVLVTLPALAQNGLPLLEIKHSSPDEMDPLADWVPYEPSSAQEESDERPTAAEVRAIDPVAYARWTMVDPKDQFYTAYSYVGGDPVNLVDPDGQQAYPIVWEDYQIGVPTPGFGSASPGGLGVPGLGHAGILLVNPSSGAGRYYEYGRYLRESGEPSIAGRVRDYPLDMAIEFEASGQPTLASLGAALHRITVESGGGGVLSAVEIPLTADQFTAARAYADGRVAQNMDPRRAPYSLTGNSCNTFVRNTVKASGNDPGTYSIVPNEYMLGLDGAHPSVTYYPPSSGVHVGTPLEGQGLIHREVEQ